MTLPEWLDQQMRQRGVRSIQVFARMVGVNPLDLGDWLIGRKVPTGRDWSQLATGTGTSESELRLVGTSDSARSLRP